ncbi:hypothetical protein SAMN05443661_12142 [Natronobacterium gregoryi]|uniref:Uncharacterized protein n=2 Tax=Natronobacterium gregoryi TaxID=44930 RepID=L0AMG0_NATGS|nr:hypothetical protein Natgr_3505 [Natronobacterium gregoryi SP2]PLK19809.1 hypothetical protein CYV19_12940 [Natronobacterium gregoryi SP2]SFJ30725.1 hypothetical protein SAMN05443661_12142 [Natronobacterium gregoryi]
MSSEGRWNDCPECNNRKMLYPEFGYICQSCFEERGVEDQIQIRIDSIERYEIDEKKYWSEEAWPAE